MSDVSIVLSWYAREGVGLRTPVYFNSDRVVRAVPVAEFSRPEVVARAISATLLAHRSLEDVDILGGG